MIDLHLHTTYSDGVSQAEDLIREAVAFGLEALAITDHDNTESYALALKASEGTALQVIPGIEINTVWTERDQEVHVLGYFINPGDPNLRRLIDAHRSARVDQIREIARLLQKKAGLDISFEEISARSRENGSLGRPHVAQAIVEKGGAASISEAFAKFLNRKAGTYLRRETASPHEAVEAIHEAGGIAVIAHPGDMNHLDTLIPALMDHGLRGLEAYHRSHSPAIIEHHCSLAEKYSLIVTGGTDYHGPADAYQSALSRLHTPDYVYRQLLEEHDRRGRATFKVS